MELAWPAKCGPSFLKGYPVMSETEARPDKKTVEVLLENHRRFLAFLERRVGSGAVAEEILQSAFAKAVESEDELERETVVAWFYRILRNALIDYYRRQDVEKRALESHRLEAVREAAELPELDRTICECFKDLLPTLKPEYSEVLKRVDLGTSSVADAAKSLGISANNAAVRLHRARLALRKRLVQTCRTCAQHGCYDCTCGKC
jgi:RNA polymerase sigma factor (sigma-70 family)